MTREAEVQKAREWIDARQDSFGVLARMSTVGHLEGVLAAYAAHSLRVELGELAKGMCVGCDVGDPMDAVYVGYHQSRGMVKIQCKATPIRRRLEALEGK